MNQIKKILARHLEPTQQERKEYKWTAITDKEFEAIYQAMKEFGDLRYEEGFADSLNANNEKDSEDYFDIDYNDDHNGLDEIF